MTDASSRRNAGVQSAKTSDAHVVKPSSDVLALAPTTRRVSDQVYVSLKSAIVRGHFEPGARLVERDLTSRFDVSRTPIREALQRLEQDGLVVCRPHCAYAVRVPHVEEAATAYEARGILETACCGLAAERATAGEIERLRALVRNGVRMLADEDYELLLLCNNDLHALLVEASHNSFLIDQHRRLWTYVDLLRGRFWSSTDRPKSGHDEHHAIVEAIADRQSGLAQQLASVHVRRAWDSVAARLRRVEAAGAAS